MKRMARASTPSTTPFWWLLFFFSCYCSSSWCARTTTVPLVTAWMTTAPATVTQHHRHRRRRGGDIVSLQKSSSSSSEKEDETVDPFNNMNSNNIGLGPEPSRMPAYVMDFLKNSQRQQAEQQDDYLIAIPVDTCHELMLELESIQRGILYHCPLLVHSCIPAAATRLPLLYVTVPPHNNNTHTKSSATALDTLHDAVYAAVQQHIPLTPPTLQFQGLEIDRGALSANQVLLAVTTTTTTTSRDENPNLLPGLVQELQQSLERLGWSTRLPYEDADEDQDQASGKEFRPRIPFMRLPENWNWYLEQQKQQKQFTNTNSTTTSTGIGSSGSTSLSSSSSSDCFLTADEGGNGISPIHWGKWADDVLGGPQRLSQVALYPRLRPSTSTSQLSSSSSSSLEQVFPWPVAAIALPNGTEAQIRSEAAFAAYQERRWADAEAALQQQQRQRGNNGVNSIDKYNNRRDADRPTQDDLLLSMTRQKLERLYEAETAATVPMDVAQPGGDVYSDDYKNNKNNNGNDDVVVLDWDDIQSELATPPQRPSDPSAVEDWTRRRIVQSRARVQSERALTIKKNKPPIAENVVFAKYKDGTLVPPEQRANDTDTMTTSTSTTSNPLPPFPSAPHCIGFWRMVSSPTGFAVEQDHEAGDSSRSDNLILRVDGTIAGGPILDPETRQKASGGTWTLELCDKENEDDASSSSTTATLRIHLLIPPQKQRVLVMMGPLVMEDNDDERARLPATSMDPVSLPTLASNTFGIPLLEARAAKAAAADEANSDTQGKNTPPRLRIACRGSVWLEDADTGRNRDDIGTFAIVKLDTPTDPRQFTITIPRNVRNQD